MITIRSAQLHDSERLFELLNHFAVTSTPSRPVFDRILPAIIGDRRSHLRVAIVDERVVAYSLAVLQWTLHANGPIVVLQELAVDEEYRGQGIGGQLMAALIEDAKLSGATEITVPTRRAKDYYPRFGFKETAGYYKLSLQD